MSIYKLTFHDGTVEYITTDSKGIANIWVNDPYVIEIEKVGENNGK
jgi:hypothetical protein